MSNKNIRFLDLSEQFQQIKTEIFTAVSRTLESGNYVLGPEVEEFEQKFAAYHDCSYGAAVNSGTSALHLALLACGVGYGDEIITTAMSFTATAAAIRYCGATPVFVDVDPKAITLDVDRLSSAISSKTKAIIPVHLYGQPCNMNEVMKLAKTHQLKVIEDCAQAHLAVVDHKKVGSFGDFGCFSFYPGKNLGAYGEGGIVLSNDSAGIDEVKSLRDWGQKKKYFHDKLGFNYRMDSIQGSILNVKLRYLEEWTQKRRDKAKIYRDELAKIGVDYQTADINSKNSYHIFSIFVPNRDQLSSSLNDAGIQTGLHYPVPMHLQECYADLLYKSGDLPVSERLSSMQLSIPLYPELEEEDIFYVLDKLKEAIN